MENKLPFSVVFHGHVRAVGSAACSWFVVFVRANKVKPSQREMWLCGRTRIRISTAYFRGLAAPPPMAHYSGLVDFFFLF